MNHPRATTANVKVAAAAQTQQAEQAKEIHAARAAELDQALQAKTRAVALLQVRLQIHQSIAHLHMRNFGLAELTAHAAGEGLAGLEPQREGYADLAEQLKNVSVDVTPEIHDQVIILTELAISLDALDAPDRDEM